MQTQAITVTSALPASDTDAPNGSESVVSLVVGWIREFAQSVSEETVVTRQATPVSYTPAAQHRTAEERRGPGVASALDSVLSDVVERIKNPDLETLGALEVDASAPVIIKINGAKAVVLSLITALARRGIHAVPGMSAERGGVRVYANGDEVAMLNWLYLNSMMGVNARILPVDLTSMPAHNPLPVAV